METTNIKSITSLKEIVFEQESGENHSIFISPNDSLFFDNFVAMYQQLMAEADNCKKKMDESDNIDDYIEKIRAYTSINLEFSTKAIEIVDSVFGEGTIYKYFYDIYQKVPTFHPDEECFLDFIDVVTPAIEDIFKRKVEGLQLRKDKMAKYKPQDHKKAQK